MLAGSIYTGEQFSSETDPLNTLWRAGNMTEFWNAAEENLRLRIQSHLRKSFGLTTEDAEDCVSVALLGLITQSEENRQAITRPKTYIWRSAINEGKHLAIRNGRAAQVIDDLSRMAVIPNENEALAVKLAEALLDDVEFQPSWVTKVVNAAIAKLRPALRETIKFELAHGPSSSGVAAVALGIAATTYRVNKSNGYKQLRTLIPQVMTEMGIPLRHVGIPDVGFADSIFPSEDETAEE